jgi:hypothetical protein
VFKASKMDHMNCTALCTRACTRCTSVVPRGVRYHAHRHASEVQALAVFEIACASGVHRAVGYHARGHASEVQALAILEAAREVQVHGRLQGHEPIDSWTRLCATLLHALHALVASRMSATCMHLVALHTLHRRIHVQAARPWCTCRKLGLTSETILC